MAESERCFKNLLEHHITQLQVEDGFATGHIDTEERFLAFREALKTFGFYFTIRSSRKEAYSDLSEEKKKLAEDGEEKDSENDTLKIKAETGLGRLKKLPGRGGVMFKSCTDVSVPFFGSPFLIETTTYLTCSQGIKYYGSKKYPDELFREGDPLAKKRRREKLSQKIGCQARMTVKKIKVFPGPDYMVSSDNWREKRTAIELLRQDFIENQNKIEHVMRYCVVISMDTSHNHPPNVKVVKRVKQTPYNPAKKVIKLHEQFQEAVDMLSSSFIKKCTNIQTLTGCCNNLKLMINQLRDSIEKNDGVPVEEIKATFDKINEKKNRMLAQAEAKNQSSKRKIKTEKMLEQDDIDLTNVKIDEHLEENNENNQIIELPSIIEGTQVVWDPLNVSWVQDVVLQESPTITSQRKETQSILVQRRSDDVTSQNQLTNQNIGLISSGGQNYTIVQHASVPNIGVTVPITMAKVVHPILASNVKKGVKSGVTTIAIPAGVDWSQQNWGQIAQVVTEGQNFTNCPTQTVWSISQ